MKKINLIIICFLQITILASCSDFLNREPLDAMGDPAYFTQESDLQYYMNGVYDGIIRTRGSKFIVGLNNGTDDLVTDSPHGSLMQHNSSGLASNTNDLWNNSYDYIRKINYFLKNAYRLKTLTPKALHYLGEGYYCRASKYFELLQAFGGVPYITEVLDTESKALYKDRSPREFIAEMITQDLDSAIRYCHWKGEGEAVQGRINKDAALVLQTRVALFEGSWEHYHGVKNTLFKAKNDNSKFFLEKTIEAGDILINRHTTNIFRGSSKNEYFEYFNQDDYSKIPGAFLYRACYKPLGITCGSIGDNSSGFGGGLTHSAVENYLMKDGLPYEISNIKENNETLNSLVENRDPRLGQTIWSPNKGRFYDYWPDWPNAYKSSYPGITEEQQRLPSYTGYRIWKSCVLYLTMDEEDKNSDLDDLIMRYEEALLNYVEAKAILKEVSQTDIDKTINIIRSRVDMPPMKLSNVNNWSINYKEQHGYDASESNIVNEIRRERRVELMLEGGRLMDLKRWAIFDKVFNGVIPLGMLTDELTSYWNSPESLQNDGFNNKPFDAVRLIKGDNYDTLNSRINPFFRHSDFKNSNSRGYYINPKRDYLQAIPKEEIELYKQKGKVVLEQNPSWN